MNILMWAMSSLGIIFFGEFVVGVEEVLPVASFFSGQSGTGHAFGT